MLCLWEGFEHNNYVIYLWRFWSKRTDFEIMQHFNISLSFIAFHIKWGKTEKNSENCKQFFITIFAIPMVVELLISFLRRRSVCFFFFWSNSFSYVHVSSFALGVRTLWYTLCYEGLACKSMSTCVIFDLGQIISFCYCIWLNEVTREFRTWSRNYIYSPLWRVYTHHACFPYSDLFSTFTKHLPKSQWQGNKDK